MKIVCPGCGSEYNIDQERLPPEGMRATCPKCTTSWLVDQAGNPTPAGAPSAAPEPSRPPPRPVAKPNIDADFDLPPKPTPPPPPRPVAPKPTMPAMPKSLAEELEGDAEELEEGTIRIFGKTIEIGDNAALKILLNPKISVSAVLAVILLFGLVTKIRHFNEDLKVKNAGWSQVDFFGIGLGDFLHSDLPLKDDIQASGTYEQNFNDGLKSLGLDTFRSLGDAEQSFRKAAKLKRSDALSLSYLGQVYAQLLNYQPQESQIAFKAKYRIHRALKLRDDLADAHRAQSELAIAQKDYVLALKSADQAVKLNKDDAQNQLTQGRILLQKGSFDAAEKCFLSARTLNAAIVPPHYYLGVTFERNTKFSEAEASLREALKINPAHSRSLLQLAKILLERSNLPNDSMAVSRQLIEQQKADAAPREIAQAHYYLALALNRTGEAAKALQVVNDGRAQDKTYVPLIVLEANLREKSETGFNAEGFVDTHVKPDMRTAEYYVFKANAAMNHGKYPDAIKALLTALDLDPHNALTHYTLGLAYENNLDNEKALHSFEKAIEEDRGFGEAFVRIASIKMDKQDYAGAAKLLDEANARNNRQAAVHDLMGKLALRQNETEKAQEKFLHALEIDPRFAEALRDMVDMYLQKKNLKEAEKAALKAQEVDPGNPKTLFAVARYYQAAGKYDQAIKIYDEILKNNSKNLSALVEAGQAAMANQDWGRAEEAISKANDLDNTNPKIYMLLGKIYFQRRKLPEAMRAFSNAQSFDPGNPAIFVRLGEVNLTEGEFPEAISNLDKALQKDPNLYEAHELLAKTYIKTAQVDQALTHLEKQNELSKEPKKKAEIYVQMGEICIDKRPDDAKKYFLKARQIDKNNARALYGYAFLLEEENNPSQAVQYYSAAIKAEKTFGLPYRQLGFIYQQTNPKQALSNFQNYLKYTPDATDREEIKEAISFLRGGR